MPLLDESVCCALSAFFDPISASRFFSAYIIDCLAPATVQTAPWLVHPSHNSSHCVSCQSRTHQTYIFRKDTSLDRRSLTDTRFISRDLPCIESSPSYPLHLPHFSEAISRLITIFSSAKFRGPSLIPEASRKTRHVQTQKEELLTAQEVCL